MTKGQDLSGEGLAYSKGNRFSIYFKGNTLEILCLLQKARAGEALVTYDVTLCDKMSQKAKRDRTICVKVSTTQGAVLLSA